MTTSDLLTEGLNHFNAEQYSQAIPLFQRALANCNPADEDQLEEQIDAYHWLGRCYLEQIQITKLAKNDKTLFEQARYYFNQQLEAASRLHNEFGIEKQINAQFWLGSGYLKWLLYGKPKTNHASYFNNAISHHHKQLKLAKKLTGILSIRKQLNANSWIGHCYLKYACLFEHFEQAVPYFEKAIFYFKQVLKLIRLYGEVEFMEDKFFANAWLGNCYLKQAMKSAPENKKILAQKAYKKLYFALQMLESNDFKNQANSHRVVMQRILETQFLLEKFDDYFEIKRKYIENRLPLYSGIKSYIALLLAVLKISPIELGKIPLAHYTKPSVCEKLFGFENVPLPMRMNSATYVNDPTEGKSLLGLLGVNNFPLCNIADMPRHNAFFTCFSTRINDLNQFRLYGKEDGVEASGCCLVFNKKGEWLKETDIVASFPMLYHQPIQCRCQYFTPTSHENLPLYQVAYIAYLDEYITDKNCHKIIEDNEEKFAIYLDQIGDHDQWYKKRVEILISTLKSLRYYFKHHKMSLEEKQDLEYVHYLFKDFAFKDEKEFRLLKMAEIGSAETQCCENTNSVFVPYANVCEMVDEVILGTNYEKTTQKRKIEVFRHKMKQLLPHIKVVHSSLPINANLPAPK